MPFTLVGMGIFMWVILIIIAFFVFALLGSWIFAILFKLNAVVIKFIMIPFEIIGGMFKKGQKISEKSKKKFT